MLSRVVVSIDPAAKAGGCVFVDGKLHKVLEFDGSSFWTSYRAFQELLEGLPEEAEYLCLIEEGFVGAPGAGSLTLGRRRGLVQAAAEAVGIQAVWFCPPGVWQPRIIPSTPKGQTKQASQAYVQQKYGITPGPDCADAICIYDFWAQYGLTIKAKKCSLYVGGKLDVRFKKFVGQVPPSQSIARVVSTPDSTGRAKRTRAKNPAVSRRKPNGGA